MQPYLVLARKFRPTNFDEVIGQEHISKTLKNDILENRVAHAYLFSGPRGVGKTTVARIFAKALNCKEGPTAHPCGVCDNCIEISKGVSIDVMEIDGASNNGIDHIRSLRENVKFVPSNSKYKIYIIDEAHQISAQAFNALLKTLEEPPEQVVFILATTEQHKILPTILSRCQKYRFKLVSSNEIAGIVREISEKENFEIDEEAINIITTSSGGSVRDALSMLEQAVSSNTSKITGEQMRELFGFLPQDIIVSTAKYLAENNMSKILKIVNNISEEGYNIMEFAKNLRDYLRESMIYAINPKINELSSEDKTSLEEQKKMFSISRHIRINNLISKALEEMRWHEQPRIILEMYLLKMCEPYYDVGELINKIAELEKTVQAETKENKTSSLSYSSAKSGAVFTKVENDSNIISDIDLIDVWEEISAEILEKYGLKAGRLSKTVVKIVSDTSIIIYTPDKFVYDGIIIYSDQITKLFKKKSNRNIEVKIIIDEKKEIFTQAPEEKEIVQDLIDTGEAESSVEYEVKEDLKENSQNQLPPNIESIAKTFGGSVKKI